MLGYKSAQISFVKLPDRQRGGLLEISFGRDREEMGIDTAPMMHNPMNFGIPNYAPQSLIRDRRKAWTVPLLSSPCTESFPRGACASETASALLSCRYGPVSVGMPAAAGRHPIYSLQQYESECIIESG